MSRIYLQFEHVGKNSTDVAMRQYVEDRWEVMYMIYGVTNIDGIRCTLIEHNNRIIACKYELSLSFFRGRSFERINIYYEKINWRRIKKDCKYWIKVLYNQPEIDIKYTEKSGPINSHKKPELI